MPRIIRFYSFLDRFEEQMHVDCERLKRQLIAQVDERFRVLREKMAQLRNQFGCGGRARSARSAQIELSDDPQVETVELDEWSQSQSALLESIRGAPSSSGRKRKSSSASGTVTNKRQKTVTTDGSNKYQCMSPGCGKSFRTDYELSRHERIHLNIKPFCCIWPDCRYSSERKDNLVQHVRVNHFKLPQVQKEQARLSILDDRNPEDYVRVDRELLQRRLQ